MYPHFKKTAMKNENDQTESSRLPALHDLGGSSSASLTLLSSLDQKGQQKSGWKDCRKCMEPYESVVNHRRTALDAVRGK